MAPRDFSTDGAFGASQSSPGSIPGVTMNDPGPTASTSIPGVTMRDPGPTMQDPGPTMREPGPTMQDPTPNDPFGGGSPLNRFALGGAMQAPGLSGGGIGDGHLNLMFAGGGSVPAVPGNQSESGEPVQQPMPGPLPPTGNPFGTRQVRPPGGIQASWKNDLDQAMQTVDAALSYGRKLHGLPSEDPDQQTKQLAQRMPTVPGNQSESGMPVQQPMPGPLPPTDNPFGKRADNDQDQQQPDAEAETETPGGAAPQQTAAGAIPDNDEETA